MEAEKKQINKFIKKLKQMPDFSSVKFIILYGSRATGKAYNFSDYDFAIYYKGDKSQRFDFRLKLLSQSPDNFDVHIFQDLPLYIRKEVLKGKVLYAKDSDFVYEISFETIKKFEDFKRQYYDYINLIKIK